MTSNKTALLHVIHTGYGEALILEYNETGTGETSFMLIGGGPASVEPVYTSSSAKFNLFFTLNQLSGSTLGSGAAPPTNVMKKIDTLVLNHDGLDHKQGIESLFSSLLRPSGAPKYKDDLYSTWVLGDAKMSTAQKPIESIWYNSLNSITKLRERDAGITVKDDWFDLQLVAYNKMVSPPVAFNADFALSQDPAGRSANFAMLNAHAASGSDPVKKGQFAIQFFGPTWSILESDQLLEMLQGNNTLSIPKYTFLKQESVKASITALSDAAINEVARLGTNEELETRFNSSTRSQSSIAFIATDGSTRILFLGDATATTLKSLYTPGGAPADFTIMKVMNHGSGFNNYWTRDAQRRAEEKTVKVIQDGKFDVSTLAHIYFFAKIRAKKYIVSTALNARSSPHMATMMGIIAAAMENETNIQIYLTKPLVPDVLKVIGENFVTESNSCIPYVAINVLHCNSHSGPVGIYDNDPDGPDWVSYVARDFRTKYPEHFVEANPRVAAIIKGSRSYRVSPDVKRLSVITTTIDPGRSDQESTGGKGLTMTGSLFGGPSASSTISAHSVPPTEAFVAAGIPNITSSNTVLTPIPVIPRAPPCVNIVSAQLLGSSTLPSHQELTSHQFFSTRPLSGFDDLLQFLVTQNELSSQDAEDIAAETTDQNALKLGVFAGLFMGMKRSEDLLASLPFDFLDSADYLNRAGGPAEWHLGNLVTKIIDPPNSEFKGSESIYSFSFSIPSRSSQSTWTLPFDTEAFAKPFKLTWDGAMSVVVLWPRYVTGITSIEFRGELATQTGTYNVVCRILLVSDQPASYTFRFADQNYDIGHYKISLAELTNVLSLNVQYRLAFEKLILPGFEQIMNDLNDDTELSNSGFTLHKVLSKMVVKDLFAEVQLANITTWNPFSLPLTLELTTLQIIVDDAYSHTSRTILARITGASRTPSSPNFNLPYHFTVQWNPQEFRLHELTLLPGISDSVSISSLLSVIGVSSAFDLSQIFPGLPNLSNSLCTSHAVVDWTNETVPDSVKFATALPNWILVEDVLEISQISVEIEAKNLASQAGRVFALNGWGLTNIAQTDIEVFFTYNHASNTNALDQIYFQVGTQQRSIPLGTIISHLLGDDTSILPDSLSSLLQETVADNFIVRADRVDGKWIVSKIHISLSIKAKINVFDGIEIMEPNLVVSIDNPFNKTTRGIYVGLNAVVEIADAICQTSFTIVSVQSNVISMVFDAGEHPLTTETVLAQFLHDADLVKLPPSLSFLAGIGIQRASLTFENNQGRFSMTEIAISASSTSSLQLWQELSLQQVTLFVSHSKYRGNKVEFDAMLTLTKSFDFLTFTLAYDGPSSTSSNSLSGSGALIPAETSPGAVWSAMATYDGKISVLDVLSNMSGIQLHDILNSVDLPALHDALDVVIYKLQIALSHSSTKSSFSFEADLDWLCFSHIRFALSKSSVWTYSFGFAVGSPDDNLIENIPILGPILKTQISLECMSVVVYNYDLDSAALDPSLHIPHTSSAGEVTLAIGCRLVFKGVMKELAGVVKLASMDIVGTVSTTGVSLAAAIGSEISLFDDSMKISGAVMIQCKKETGMLPMLGILGNATLDFGSWISKEPINVSLWLLVDTSTTGLGFKFTLDKWHGVFGFDGLDFDDVVFAATFPPEQFPVPSSFTIKGSVSLRVNKAGVTGSVNIHFVEQNLMSSYATGSIEGLTLNTLIEVFAQVPSTPDYLNAGFGPLKFAIVPKDTVDESGKALKQQFMMEGSFKLPFIHFEAAVKVDISPKKVTIDGYIKRIVILHEKLFSILPSPEESPAPPPDAGASIHVHINDETSPFFAEASGQLTFLGIEKDLHFQISEKGLEFLLSQDIWTNKGALSGSIDDTHLEVAASYEFSLDLITPNFKVGDFSFTTTRIIAFAAALALDVEWEDIAWQLQVSGSFQLFSMKIEKSFTVGASLTDLEAIGKKIAQWIIGTLAEDFLGALKKILSSLEDVIKVLKEAGLVMVDILKFLIHELGVAFEVAAHAIKDFFGVAWELVVNLLRGLGYVAQEIADGLKRIGVAAVEIATAIGKEWGEAVRDLCSTILREAGSITSEIVDFFRNVLQDPGQAIVDILVSWGRSIISIFSSVAKVLVAPFKAVFDWIFGSRPKKTREQVQEELLLTLMIRMNQLLDKPVDIQTEEDLEIIMRRCAIQRFGENFGYDFRGPSTIPPSSQSPKAVTTTENKVSYTDGQSSHMNDYRDQILSGLQLESWMKDAATSDLNEEIQLLLDVVPSTFWQVVPLRKTYYPANSSQNPVELNSIIIFVNGALSFDGHYVTNTQSYFIGVYYEAPQPAIVARQVLRKQAFTTVPGTNPSPVVDDDALSTALTAYAAEEFKNQFHFDYQQAPPDSQDTSLFHKPFNVLSYFQDGNVDGVETYLTAMILSMAPIPDWAEGKMLSDMSGAYRQIVTSQEKGSWRNVLINHSYDGPGKSFNTINCQGLIIYYVDTKTTDQIVTVSIAYVFFLGVFYQVPNHVALVRKDLIEAVCNALAHHMNNPESMATQPDEIRLTTFVERFGRDQFYKFFGFELMDEATSPDKRVPNTPLLTIARTGEFEDRSDKKVQDWVDSFLSDTSFPPASMDSHIRQDMIDTIKYKISGASGTKNSWSDDSYDKVYTYEGEDEKQIRVAGSFIHCNGSLTSGSDTVEISFVHFSGVFFVEEDSW